MVFGVDSSCSRQAARWERGEISNNVYIIVCHDLVLGADTKRRKAIR